MKVSRPFIVNLACTDVLPTRVMSPHVPLSRDEIVADAGRCLEGNLWFDQQRAVPASNDALVERLVALAAMLERPLMPRPEVRRMLGLEG